MKHYHHSHHSHAHFTLSYPLSFFQRVFTFLVGPLVMLLLMYAAFTLYPVLAPPQSADVPLSTILVASLYTCARIAISYVFALAVALPLALVAVSNRAFEAVLLPIFDVLESIPILALFPVIVLLFVRFGNLNGAAVFILFISMLWSIVFTVVGGLKMIPPDIVQAAQVFGIRRFSYFRKVILPAVFPHIVTGSILAVAAGWNLVIVAEAVHTYLPGGTSAEDLFGVGSILVHASANAQHGVFLTACLAMIVFIAFFNLFVWQRLLRLAERFRFD